MDSSKLSQSLPVGTELQERYRVERQLNSGGFGNTYVVKNLRFDETWAMKEFFMKSISERDGDTTTVSVAAASKQQFEAQREKFVKEARRLRRFRHPGIVHVEDLFDENGTSYYIMDYIDGGSLKEVIKRHGPFSEARVRQLLPDLLDALEYVHAQKLWHLDLKPGNILLKDNGHPVLIDFGASKQLGVGGANSTSIGMTYTQGYAPSEQVDQNLDRIGPWTDLYALGATIYNLVSGYDPPLVSEIQEAGADAFNFPKGLSQKMRDLIMWMMNPNRRQRPQSVAEVRDFLKDNDERVEPDSNTKGSLDDDGTRLPNHEPEPTPKSSFWNSLTIVHKRIIGAVAVLSIILIAFILWPSDNTENPVTEQEAREHILDVVAPTTVTDKTFTSSVLGEYKYTGPIDTDGKPHGTGEATFADGRSYRGPFVHGVMQGSDAFFRMKNGDTFQGEFRNDRFHQGTYTVKEDGSLFKGSFTNGQPDQGNWYDKNGNRL